MIPKHVAIIMDGNSRWAEKNGLSRLEGHRAGARNIRTIANAAVDCDIEYLTLYAFSSENWGRPRDEVNSLLHIFGEMIDSDLDTLHGEGIRLHRMGRLSELPGDLRQKVTGAIELTKNNTGLTLNIAFDYGGRAEITDAVRQLVRDNVPPEKIDETLISTYLYLPSVPDPDLIIRTGDQRRLSNFLLWQSAYSELYFTDVFWPDFDQAEMEKALKDYAKRQRSFGKRRTMPVD